tara:strand:- start:394 stop:867 length:474 start_codon:yes stop_codon:yes gene_type:complete
MYSRVLSLIVSIILFAFVYFFLDDSHFSGINALNEAIREEILKRNATKQIKEEFIPVIKGIREPGKPGKPENIDVNIVNKREEREIKKSTLDIKTQLKDVELEKAITPSPFQKFLDRLYLSAVTGTTVGYGDIYPRTNLCRMIVMLQLIVSISIVFF